VKLLSGDVNYLLTATYFFSFSTLWLVGSDSSARHPLLGCW